MEYSDTHFPAQPRVELAALVAMLFIVFIGLNVILDRASPGSTRAAQAGEQDSQPAGFEAGDPALIAAPYNKYTVTQGLHGFSYGHLAIDLAAGKGKPIKSPIYGVVTEKYTDRYGNPTLVIENEVYRITLLHGRYIVEVGQGLKLGQVVGEESNKGYTTDMQGNPCRQRQCGYHTHLNIFDKRIQANVNPLTLLEKNK
jgi:murein DD-endopeptidase MepM/ murein hydrolase activator NlpD